MKRIRGALGMGLTWAAGWAVFGVLIGVSSTVFTGLPWDSFFRIFDAPLPALGIPGFVGGLIFSTVLGIAGRRRKFDELSVPRFAAWGAAGGLLLSLVPAAFVAVGAASIGTEEVGLWELTAVISVPLIFLSAVSAATSLLLARRAKGRELTEEEQLVADVRRIARPPERSLGAGAMRSAVEPRSSAALEKRGSQNTDRIR